MWCNKCHYHSTVHVTTKCPQCPGQIDLEKSPFPAHPEGHGSGKPNGKTDRSRKVTKKA